MEEMGRADTHLHTYYSGYNTKVGRLRFPESVVTPEQQVDNARRLGLDVLCVTDHNETAGAFIAEKYARQFDDIEIVVGDEVMTDQGEVIGLWLTEKPRSFLSPEETVDIIHEQGGLAIAPHPFSVHVDGLQEKILELDLEGIETLNGGHPDPYSNHFAQKVADAFPGRWATLSGSDAHALCTAGYNWTEFEGRTADDFRKAILKKATVPVGEPSSVFSQFQWSMEVVYGGQKLAYKALKRELEPVPDNALIAKTLSNTDLKNATGIAMGFVYNIPFTGILATLISTFALRLRAKKTMKTMEMRLEEIIRKVAEIDAAKVRILPSASTPEKPQEKELPRVIVR